MIRRTFDKLKIFFLLSLYLTQICYSSPNKVSNKIHLNVKQGGFKMLDGEGSIVLEGSGTLLLSKFIGKAQIPKGMRLEYEGNLRKVYFGSGLVKLDGNFRAIQWVGKSLKATWQGKGNIKLLTEENMGTGEGYYWFEGSSKKFHWKNMNHFSIRLPFELENTKTKYKK